MMMMIKRQPDRLEQHAPQGGGEHLRKRFDGRIDHAAQVSPAAAQGKPGDYDDWRELVVVYRNERDYLIGISGRQIGPCHRLVVETAHDGRLHHLEIGRDIEITWCIERRMADLQNFLPRRFAFEPRYLRQDRIAHILERLRDQRRADDARRVTGAERHHAPPPTLRHRQRKTGSASGR